MPAHACARISKASISWAASTRSAGLVPQLHDVHASRERGIDELGEVAVRQPRIRAEVELRVRETFSDLVTVEARHTATVVRPDAG